MSEAKHLGAEAIEGLALALERVYDIEGRHGFSAGMLSVGDGILDDVLKKDLQDAAGLLVHQARNALDATTTSQATDRGLGDALDVVTHDLAMALGAALTKALSTLSAAGHDELDVEGGDTTSLSVMS